MSPTRAELLRGLSAEQANAVVALGTSKSVPKGQDLFRLGWRADHLFILERGRIDLTLPMQLMDREEDVLVEELSPGQALGWSALIPPHRFTLDAKAQLDSRVLAIPRVGLDDYFSVHPDVAYALSRNVAEIVGGRLQVFQAMWLREMQRAIARRVRAGGEAS